MLGDVYAHESMKILCFSNILRSSLHTNSSDTNRIESLDFSRTLVTSSPCTQATRLGRTSITSKTRPARSATPNPKSETFTPGPRPTPPVTSQQTPQKKIKKKKKRSGLSESDVSPRADLASVSDVAPPPREANLLPASRPPRAGACLDARADAYPRSLLRTQHRTRDSTAHIPPIPRTDGNGCPPRRTGSRNLLHVERHARTRVVTATNPLSCRLPLLHPLFSSNLFVRAPPVRRRRNPRLAANRTRALSLWLISCHRHHQSGVVSEICLGVRGGSIGGWRRRRWRHHP